MERALQKYVLLLVEAVGEELRSGLHPLAEGRAVDAAVARHQGQRTLLLGREVLARAAFVAQRDRRPSSGLHTSLEAILLHDGAAVTAAAH